MSTISASTLITTALQYTADTTGTLVFKTGATPTTALTLNADQSATFAGTVNFATAGFTNLSYTGTLTGGTGVIAIGTNQIYKTAGGNVGIGTASPTAPLHVYGSTNGVIASIVENADVGVQAQSRTNYVSTGYQFIVGSSNVTSLGAGGFLYTTGAQPIAFFTAANERMRITPAGSLYINTTVAQITSSEVLSVNGITTISNSGATANLNIYNTNTTASTNLPYISMQDSGGSGRGGIGMNYTDAAMWISGFNGIRFRYGSNQPGTTEAMRIDSSGNLIVGNTSYVTTGVSTGVVASTALVVGGQAAGADAMYVRRGGSAITQFQTTSGGANAGTISLQPAGGSVGIGTDTPGVKLDVVGGTVRSSVSGGTPIFYLNNGTTQHSIQNNSGVLGFYNDGNNQANITGAGNFQFNSGYGSVQTAYGVRAWANYNASGGTIRASGGISSITKNSNGFYTINFGITFPDTNYSTTVNAGSPNSSSYETSGVYTPSNTSYGNKTTTAVQINCFTPAVANYDPYEVNIIVMR